MLEFITNYLLDMAYREVSDFMEYIGWEGEVCKGFTNSLNQDIDDCVTILDDEGHGVFLIYVDDVDRGTYSGVMCEKHVAPNQEGRGRYIQSDTTVIKIIRWGLGI